MEKITPEEIENALLRSGYLLENRVLEFFTAKKFWAESSHTYFLYGEEQKYREIDVLATKFIDSISFGSTKENLSLYSNFICECINNPVPLALFKSNGDTEEPTTDWSYNLINGSEELLEITSITWPSSIHQFEKRIIQSLPSRQYCGFIMKKNPSKDKWMACHPDDFHQTLLKLAQAIKYKKDEKERNWQGRQPQMCRLELFIPLIVLQGDMLEVISQKKIGVKPVNYYRLKVPYDNNYNKSISIDIVTESYLPTYFKRKIQGLKLMFRDLKESLSVYNSV